MAMVSAHFRDHLFITFDTPMRADVISVRPIFDWFIFWFFQKENSKQSQGDWIRLKMKKIGGELGASLACGSSPSFLGGRGKFIAAGHRAMHRHGIPTSLDSEADTPL